MGLLCGRQVAVSLTATLFILLGGAAGAVESGPEMVITVRGGESVDDTRYDYDTAVLRLALEKTRSTGGPFRIVTAPPMNYSRAIASVSAGEYPNYFIKLSYESRYAESLGMDYVRFPVDLGIVGYRVCFVNRELKPELARVTSIDELRRYTHGQGRDWADVQILRSNGFQVVEVDNYENLFPMVARRRFDLFCRGTNELLDEYRSHSTLRDFSFDEHFSIAYPLPRFFFTHRRNAKAIARIQEGILIAYRDGSLRALWQSKYRESIAFARLDQRRIFWLDNPLLKNVDFNYQQYFVDPLKLDNQPLPPKERQKNPARMP